jgi:hypothetical protein
LEKIHRIVSLISNHMLGFEISYQCLCLGDVVTLTCCELKAQRVAQSIHAHVDLGTEPASAPAKSLGRLATVFLEAPAAQG